jgi:DNA-3-methyladenine glycosylase
VNELLRGEASDVARGLLGARLVHVCAEGRTAGRIVETEAYLAAGDQASHSRSGPTARNASMFLAAGHAYVYRIYGMHHCFNVVTGSAGEGQAVLIRALEPLEGLDLMRVRRGRDSARELCSGPAKLVSALGITAAHDGLDLTRGELRVEFPGSSGSEVLVGPRVGITRDAHLPLRFRLADCPWCSS